MCLSRLKGFGIQSSVKGFDSRLIDVIDVIDAYCVVHDIDQRNSGHCN
jgi:hypothetical protein